MGEQSAILDRSARRSSPRTKYGASKFFFIFFCLIIWRLARVVKGNLAESGLSSVFTPQSTSLAKNESLTHLWSHQLRSPVNETNNQDTKNRISAPSSEQEMYCHPKLMVYLEARPCPEHVLLETLDESGENIRKLARWRIIQNHCEITIDFGWSTNWVSLSILYTSLVHVEATAERLRVDKNKTATRRHNSLFALAVTFSVMQRWSLTSSNYVDVLHCLQLLQSIQMRNQQEFISSAQDCCSRRGIMQEETERNCSSILCLCPGGAELDKAHVCSDHLLKLRAFCGSVSVSLCSFCNTEDSLLLCLGCCTTEQQCDHCGSYLWLGPFVALFTFI